ncbi:hypothetical protein C6366_01390 [Desulfonatronum sp. SC1]|nr:hypothetical protein C6366_01390 [Desulfonatronum sp. SC1]
MFFAFWSANWTHKVWSRIADKMNWKIKILIRIGIDLRHGWFSDSDSHGDFGFEVSWVFATYNSQTHEETR